MDNMIFTSEVCGVVLIAPFDKISRPPCSTIRFIVFLSLFFRCFSPFSFYHRTFSLTTPTDDSDYDLCVIVPENSMRPVDAVKAIRRALLPLQTMSLDILVYRADTFFRRAQGVTMERKIKRDGIPLYENFSHKS